jgi:hypothetical protein
MKKGWTCYDLVDLSDSLHSFLVDYAEHEIISTLTANANQLLMAIRQIDSNEQHTNQEVEEPEPSIRPTERQVEKLRAVWMSTHDPYSVARADAYSEYIMAFFALKEEGIQ